MILTADLHQTTNPRDADRWNLFPWLRSMVKKYREQYVGILGDITDAKDRHEAALVNRMVDEIYELAQVCKVIILPGNHDGIDPGKPFFRFMKRLKGNVTFVTDPTEINIAGQETLWLPHTKDYEQDWQDWKANFSCYRYIFCHQTFDGALAENGTELRGIPPRVFNKLSDCNLEVFSGDIHVPQKIGKRIEYVGSPYRVHFGDSFRPRVLLIGAEERNLFYPGKGREVITAGRIEEIEQHDYLMGTQVKIRVRLRRSDFPDWPKIRREIQKLVDSRGWELCGLELKLRKPKSKAQEEETYHSSDELEALLNYAKRKKADKKLIKLGVEFLKGAKNG